MHVEQIAYPAFVEKARKILYQEEQDLQDYITHEQRHERRHIGGNKEALRHLRNNTNPQTIHKNAKQKIKDAYEEIAKARGKKLQAQQDNLKKEI